MEHMALLIRFGVAAVPRLRFAPLVFALTVLFGVPGVRAYALPASLSPRLREATILQRENPTTQHRIVVSLDLKSRDELERFLSDTQNPQSPNYRQFLTPDEFNARYAPTVDAEQRVVDFLEANGFSVTDRFPNRLLVGAVGSVAMLEQTFGLELHNVTVDGEAHYAAINEPTWPADLADTVVGIIGLDDLTVMHPSIHTRTAAAPSAAQGSSCCALSPNDLAVFYDNRSGYTGDGETLVIAGVYAWSDADVVAFDFQWGLPALPSGSGQVCAGSSSSDPMPDGCTFKPPVPQPTPNPTPGPTPTHPFDSGEASLDVEYAHGTAPGAKILNYMAASPSPGDLMSMYNRILTDNPGHIVTTSWGYCEAGTTTAIQITDDILFASANAIGQSWFAASGDHGSRECGTRMPNGTYETTEGVWHPANSPHVIGVGGTTPTCSTMNPIDPECSGYGFESGWNYSGGGFSQVFPRPTFQAGCSVPKADTPRLVPDVALEASPSPGNWLLFDTSWHIAGGTSVAAPQWAGFFAELNQKLGGNGLGNPGSVLYGLCSTNAFHDITVGSNGDYDAGVGYDMVTGIGSPDVGHLLAAYGLATPTATLQPIASVSGGCQIVLGPDGTHAGLLFLPIAALLWLRRRSDYAHEETFQRQPDGRGSRVGRLRRSRRCRASGGEVE